jgi:hypothetical protein
MAVRIGVESLGLTGSGLTTDGSGCGGRNESCSSSSSESSTTKESLCLTTGPGEDFGGNGLATLGDGFALGAAANISSRFLGFAGGDEMLELAGDSTVAAANETRSADPAVLDALDADLAATGVVSIFFGFSRF